MKSGYGFYKFCYCVARAALSIFYRIKITGKENIPSGAAMVCANHSSLMDPVLLAFAFGLGTHLRIIAKAELYRVPVLSAIIRRLGTIKVDRGGLDIQTIKDTLSCLNKGEKVAIFPEGTRKQEEIAGAAKNGAVKLSERAKVPLVPCYIPRKKPLFRKIHLIIGEPYYIANQKEKRSADDYANLADALMDRIAALPDSCYKPGSGECV